MFLKRGLGRGLRWRLGVVERGDGWYGFSIDHCFDLGAINCGLAGSMGRNETMR